jgi:hypothetical protein
MSRLERRLTQNPELQEIWGKFNLESLNSGSNFCSGDDLGAQVIKDIDQEDDVSYYEDHQKPVSKLFQQVPEEDREAPN